MDEFILFMHDDATDPALADSGEAWAAYLRRLRESGCFDGGSSVGPGIACRKGRDDAAARTPINGFLRIHCDDLATARALLDENPVYEAGGTVEVRALLKD